MKNVKWINVSLSTLAAISAISVSSPKELDQNEVETVRQIQKLVNDTDFTKYPEFVGAESCPCKGGKS